MILFVGSIDAICCVIIRDTIYMELKFVRLAFYLLKYVKIYQNKFLLFLELLFFITCYYYIKCYYLLYAVMTAA
jgi:hypothetical protein